METFSYLILLKPKILTTAWAAFQFMFSDLKNDTINKYRRKQHKLSKIFKKYKSISLSLIDKKDLVCYLEAEKGDKLSVKTH